MGLIDVSRVWLRFSVGTLCLALSARIVTQLWNEHVTSQDSKEWARLLRQEHERQRG